MERDGDPLGFLDPAGADGAAGGTGSGAGIDCGLPDMALGAAPPDLFTGTGGHRMRKYGISVCSPLGFQLRIFYKVIL